MTKPTDRAAFLGVSVDARTAQALAAFHKTLTRNGRRIIRATQGSPSGYVKSGGTHAGQGVIDLVLVGGTDRQYRNVVRKLRRKGFAAWERSYNWDGEGGIRHIHAVLIGHPDLSVQAAAQVVAYLNGRNGLKNNAADPMRYHPRYRHTWRAPKARR